MDTKGDKPNEVSESSKSVGYVNPAAEATRFKKGVSGHRD